MKFCLFNSLRADHCCDSFYYQLRMNVARAYGGGIVGLGREGIKVQYRMESHRLTRKYADDQL